MKKTYIIPALTAQYIETQNIIALSMLEKTADGSDALVKGDGDWDIWNEDNDLDEEE